MELQPIVTQLMNFVVNFWLLGDAAKVANGDLDETVSIWEGTDFD